MRYNETYLGTARDVYDLIVLLTDEEDTQNRLDRNRY